MLNSQQQKAVETTEGKVLVLAGAGSGKTKVIVHRIAHLIKNKQVDPSSILGLTFTNKAAHEMRHRIADLLTKPLAKKVNLSTFHSFCMRLLRKEIHHLGWTSTFSLYDGQGIRRMVKQLAYDELEHDGPLPSIEPVLEKISLARSQRSTPDDPTSQILYERLNESLRACNALDFDSLLSLTVDLFENHPDVLKKYQNHFSHIMIDEYQDTNPVQYQIAKLLCQNHNNLCVVGDDDQSIYGWRGAQIQNILSFDSDHLIRLEQNYRSLPPILKAANAVIANNTSRHEKTLFSKSTDTESILLFHAPTEQDEATSVVQRLLHLKQTRNLAWKDFAILYRSNAISRPFEIALVQAMWRDKGESLRGIPYQVFGGTELFERSEIKDLMAYLRLIHNPLDEDALLRIINVPRRGISEKTLSILTKENRSKKIPLWDVLKKADQYQLTQRALKSIAHFITLIETAQNNFQTLPTYKEAIENLLETTHYKKAIEEEVKSEKMRKFKWENIQSCIETIDTYQKENTNPSLADFLSTTMLDEGRFSKKRDKMGEDRVSLMTFHSAKGLEFEAVFLVALEDHIIPHEKSIQLEEERRLMYVAITRAKRYLTLSMAKVRKRYGKDTSSNPSRFVFEIPKELLRITQWRHPI